MASPYQTYRDLSAQTASPAKLLLMLFDGAIRFTKQSIEGLETGDYVKVNENLAKVQAILNELMTSLDRSYPIAEDMLRMYEYMHYTAIQANIRKDVQLAQEVLTYLQQFKETWTEASKIAGSTSMESPYVQQS